MIPANMKHHYHDRPFSITAQAYNGQPLNEEAFADLPRSNS